MEQEEVWDVACYVCGCQLGSNQDKCGIKNGKRMAKPPCVWARSTPSVVQKSYTIAAAKKKEQESDDQRDAQIRVEMANGRTFNYEEPVHAVDQEHQLQLQRLEEAEKQRLQREDEEFVAQQQADDQEKDDDTDEEGDRKGTDEEGKDGKDVKDAKKQEKTKWNTITRTMFFKCIQKEDPFNSDNKAASWQRIAEAMHTATAVYATSRDGDYRTYSNGKTLSVFYARCREQRKKMEDGESHSGVAGGGRELDPAVQEERNQLYACIVAERSAKEAVETKRVISKADATFKNGECNDIVIKCAVDNEQIRHKAIKVVASRLRELKMRRLAWEAQERASGRNGQYTYTAEDLKNFQYWNDLKEADTTLPEDPTETDEAGDAAATRGGGLAKAIAAFTEKLATASQFRPMPVEEFASAFFKAKREHEAQSTRSLRQKLSAIEQDVADRTITAEQGELYKKQVTDAHYSNM